MTHCNCCAVGQAERKANERRRSSEPSTVWRRFEFDDGFNSSKFWSIRMDYDPTVVWVKYGKMGTKGTLIKKDFAWSYQARDFYSRMVKEKLGKGYEYAGWAS
jgi:predicted DNA-binding WGR domain protein